MIAAVPSLAAFLLARIEEDEADAEAAHGFDWHVHTGLSGHVTTSIGSDAAVCATRTAEHIARHDPARVLAECAAKRAIVESLDSHERYPDAYPGMVALADWHVRVLAAVHADHPDYRPEWRP